MAAGDVTSSITTNNFKKAGWFDGVNDKASKLISGYRSGDTQGAIYFEGLTKDLTVGQVGFGTCDTAGNTKSFLFGIDSAGKLLISRNDNLGVAGITGNTVVTANTWFRAILTSDGSAYKLYLNGIEDTPYTVAGSNDGKWFDQIPDRDNITIGTFTRNLGSGSFWNGGLRKVRIYDKCPTANEITKLSNGARVTNNLVSEWNLEDDFNDSVGSDNLTASGAVNSIRDGLVAEATAGLRTTANDKWMALPLIGGQIVTVNVEEA